MKNYNELTLTDLKYLNLMNMNKKLKEHLDESDLGEIIRMRRDSKSWILPTSYWFLSQEETEYRKLQNEKVLERIKIIDDYLVENYSNEVNEFIEYEGDTIKKSNVLMLVWEDKWCRNEGVTVKMDGFDFQGSDFESLIDSIKEYYKDEIKRKKGCIEVEVNGKPILHISPDSKNKWEVI